MKISNKLSPFKLADSVDDITKSKFANAAIVDNDYILLETNNEEQPKLRLAAKSTCFHKTTSTPVTSFTCSDLPDY